MIQEDARRCLELDEKIKRLEAKIAEVAKVSKIAKILRTIPGFGAVCSSELAGEMGTMSGLAMMYSAHVCFSPAKRAAGAKKLGRAPTAWTSHLDLWAAYRPALNTLG